MKHIFEKDYDVLLVTDNRGNKFIENFKEFKSYILKSGTPTNKNIIKKFISFFIIFYSLIQSIIIIKKGKTRFDIWFWWLCIFSNIFCINFF